MVDKQTCGKLVTLYEQHRQATNKLEIVNKSSKQSWQVLVALDGNHGTNISVDFDRGYLQQQCINKIIMLEGQIARLGGTLYEWFLVSI